MYFNVKFVTTGRSETNIVLQIHPDDIPETDEEFVVHLTLVNPNDTQRLIPGASRLSVTILESDAPGGTFQFAPNMQSAYLLHVCIHC